MTLLSMFDVGFIKKIHCIKLKMQLPEICSRVNLDFDDLEFKIHGYIISVILTTQRIDISFDEER